MTKPMRFCPVFAPLSSMIIGHTRVSAGDQNLDARANALKAAVRDAAEGIVEPGLWVEAVELGGLRAGVDGQLRIPRHPAICSTSIRPVVP